MCNLAAAMSAAAAMNAAAACAANTRQPTNVDSQIHLNNPFVFVITMYSITKFKVNPERYNKLNGLGFKKI